MSETTKPRFRVNTDGLLTGANGRSFTGDSFQNFAANVGIGTGNLTSAGTYGFNPITRNRTIIEWSYRGSWIVRNVVDAVADDMTRAKIRVSNDDSPDDEQKLQQYWNQIWKRLNQTIKWARLYGGCLAVMMIKGQRPEDPFQVESVGEGSFSGILVLDRWMTWPSLEDPVTDYGVDFGKPKFYTTNSDARSIPTMKIYHSRVIRIDGDELPYWQRIAENDWGLSVLEPLWDRLLAFDSTTQGAAQLAMKAHLRTYYVEKLRDIIALGGKTYQALVQQVNMIRLMQTSEGMSLFDSTDRFEAQTYSFAGLSDILIQFSQQLSGAARIPLTRLFGQSPAGLNSTGESDMNNYYDLIAASQESDLRGGIETLRSVTYRSRFGRPPPSGETFEFTSLIKLSDADKANVASTILQTASAAVEGGLMTRQTAMKEIKQWAPITGFGSNLTDEEIDDANDGDPPSIDQLTANRFADPIDKIRAMHGLLPDDHDDHLDGAQPGEEEVTGGAETGQGVPGQHTPPGAPLAPPGPQDKAFVRDAYPPGWVEDVELEG